MGTLLGLNLSHEIERALDETIKVHRKKEKGSEFIFYLQMYT